MKKILILGNYFYPDKVAFVPLITELCIELSLDYRITVIAAGENQKEILKKQNFKENIDVIRVKTSKVDKSDKLSRVKYIITYFINSIFAIIKEKDVDLIYTVSQPPILGGVLGIIAKTIKQKPLIYNIQDFNPEAIEVIGYSKNRILIKFLKKLDNFSCRLSNKIIVVGRDMKEKFKERYKYKNVPEVVVINNWASEEELFPLNKDNSKIIEIKRKNDLQDKFIIMYSGNIGLFYGLEEVIKVFAKFKLEKDIIFLFIGEGAIKKKLITYVKENEIENIKFLPYQKREDLIYSLNLADIHLVTNAKGIKGISVPSKIYGVLSVGKPILGILEKDSEARNIIEEAHCGYVCDPGDFQALENIIKEILENKEKLEEIGKKGRKILEEKYTKNKSIEKYKLLLKNLTKKEVD